MSGRSSVLRWFVGSAAALFLAALAGIAGLFAEAAEGPAASKEAMIRVFAQEKAPQPIPRAIAP